MLFALPGFVLPRWIVALIRWLIVAFMNACACRHASRAARISVLAPLPAQMAGRRPATSLRRLISAVALSVPDIRDHAAESRSKFVNGVAPAVPCIRPWRRRRLKRELATRSRGLSTPKVGHEVSPGGSKRFGHALSPAPHEVPQGSRPGPEASGWLAEFSAGIAASSDRC